MSRDVSEQVAETHGSRAGSRVGSRTNWPRRPVRAHREALLASIPHMYWFGRFEDTTGRAGRRPASRAPRRSSWEMVFRVPVALTDALYLME